jgi:hypothetical protein
MMNPTIYTRMLSVRFGSSLFLIQLLGGSVMYNRNLIRSRIRSIYMKKVQCELSAWKIRYSAFPSEDIERPVLLGY